MALLRWKTNKNCNNADFAVSQRPGKPVDLTFINIDSPGQLTNPEIQRKVRRHVAASVAKAPRQQALSTQAVDQKACTVLERLTKATTYLERVQVCQHFQRVFRAVGLSDYGALWLALDDTAANFSRGTDDTEPIPHGSLGYDSLKRYTTSLRTVRARMLQPPNGADRYQAIGTAICLAFYDVIQVH